MPYFDSVADAYFDRYREDSIGEHARRERKASVLEPLGRPGAAAGRWLRSRRDGSGPARSRPRGVGAGCRPRDDRTLPRAFREDQSRPLCAARGYEAVFPDGIFDALISIGVLNRLHVILLLNPEKVRNDKELVSSVSFTSWMSLGCSRKPNFDSLPTIPCWRSVPSIFLGFDSTNGYM